MTRKDNFDQFRSFWRSISKIPISKIDHEGIEIRQNDDRNRSPDDRNRSSKISLKNPEKIVGGSTPIFTPLCKMQCCFCKFFVADKCVAGEKERFTPLHQRHERGPADKQRKQTTKA